MGIINKFKILFFLLPVIIYSQEINENLTNFSVVDTLIHKVQKKTNTLLNF